MNGTTRERIEGVVVNYGARVVTVSADGIVEIDGNEHTAIPALSAHLATIGVAPVTYHSRRT